MVYHLDTFPISPRAATFLVQGGTSVCSLSFEERRKNFHWIAFTLNFRHLHTGVTDRSNKTSRNQSLNEQPGSEVNHRSFESNPERNRVLATADTIRTILRVLKSGGHLTMGSTDDKTKVCLEQIYVTKTCCERFGPPFWVNMDTM